VISVRPSAAVDPICYRTLTARPCSASFRKAGATKLISPSCYFSSLYVICGASDLLSPRRALRNSNSQPADLKSTTLIRWATGDRPSEFSTILNFPLRQRADLLGGRRAHRRHTGFIKPAHSRFVLVHDTSRVQRFGSRVSRLLVSFGAGSERPALAIIVDARRRRPSPINVAAASTMSRSSARSRSRVSSRSRECRFRPLSPCRDPSRLLKRPCSSSRRARPRQRNSPYRCTNARHGASMSIRSSIGHVS
jgi:hypothetical protein